MPDRNRRTNLLLLLVMVLICTGCALLFRQSTAYPSKVEGGTVRLFASEDTEKPEADNGSSKTDVSESEEKVSPAATPTATPVPFEVSPEAEKGVDFQRKQLDVYGRRTGVYRLAYRYRWKALFF